MLKRFSVKRASLIWSLARGDARLLWRALKHPRSPPTPPPPRWLLPATLLLVAYVLSPVDFIPDFIPLLGVIDDLVLLPLVIRFMLGRLPADLRGELEQQSP
jgi:uncharacterized membrane protein YkvA (DUF1232 family)